MDTKPYVSQYGLLGLAVSKCWGFGIGSGSLSGNWGIGVDVLGIGDFRCYIKVNKKKIIFKICNISLRAKLFTSLKANLYQDIEGSYLDGGWCINGTFP